MSSMDCKEILETLRPAAMECGALALDAFYAQKAGQNVTGKAVIDQEIEVHLHRVLMEITPSYGFLAEEYPELHQMPKDGEDRFWLIDPNDGTKPFQQGYRGPSISIALIAAGRPILGIVYAYAARCGQGDYFEWSKDTALRRNGLYVQWQQAHPIALVSNNAELRHNAYQALVHPLRYQPAPGIAYRLALAAVGRGRVALSLGQPRALDLAGGHALLIGAGLDLFDKEGTPLTYECNPDAPRSAVIGGLREDCLQLFRKISKEKLRIKAMSPPWYVAPRLEQQVTDIELLDRVTGAVVGCLLADSVTHNTSILDCQDQMHWTDDLGAIGKVGGYLVANLNALLEAPKLAELPHSNPGIITILPRLLGWTAPEFKAWLESQDDDIRQFGTWLSHTVFPKLFPPTDNPLFEELELTVNGAVSFIDGLGLAEQNGVTDRRLLWIATYLGANFGRNGLPEGMVACLETCRPNHTDDKRDQTFVTRPDILVERLVAIGTLNG